MTDPVARCPDHGFYEGGECPDCGARGERVLSGSRRRQLSKFTSGALRHFPEDAGLTLDPAGWTTREALVEAVTDKYDWGTAEAVDAVVATDPKGRFEVTVRDGTEYVRAAYGHSVDVDLADTDDPVPDTLYHGTAPRNLDAIRSEGLKPMNRQFVHLSGSREAALEVGCRHADDPTLLRVDVAGLESAGHTVTRRGRSVYTTDRVPPAFLSRVE